MRYRVIIRLADWVIDLDAKSPVEAAKEALTLLQEKPEAAFLDPTITVKNLDEPEAEIKTYLF